MTLKSPSKYFIQKQPLFLVTQGAMSSREDTFENVVWKMATILFRHQCVYRMMRNLYGQQWHVHSYIVPYIIRMTSHERKCVSFHRLLDCLFQSLFRLTTKNQSSWLPILCVGNPPVIDNHSWIVIPGHDFVTSSREPPSILTRGEDEQSSFNTLRSI